MTRFGISVLRVSTIMNFFFFCGVVVDDCGSRLMCR